MGAPRSSGGFAVHADDIDALADYVDSITPISGQNTTVDHSVTGKGRVINASLPPPAPPPTPDIPAFPFDVIAADDPGDETNSSVYGQVNAESLFRPDESSADDMTVSNIGTDFELQAGMYVYLQVDFNDTTGDVDAVSVIWDTDGFGDKFIKITGSGTNDDPYRNDQAFFMLAQVFDSDGTVEHGGTVFTSGNGNNSLEVVNVCSTHLGLVQTVVNGVNALGVLKTSASFDFS